jgi:regulatory protein YycH of two-component signal transduction system YycFG
MIKHIAINDFEDVKVKQQAQLALFDFCSVPHTSKVLLDNLQQKLDVEKFIAKTILKEDLNVLFSEQPLVVEGVMKLIFCGFLVDEAVVAKLLQTFFIYQNSLDIAHPSTKTKNKSKSSGEEVELLQDMVTSDAQHLQQMLSVFLHSFLLSTVEINRVEENCMNSSCFEVVRQSMPLFIAEVTTSVRDEIVSPATLSKVITISKN